MDAGAIVGWLIGIMIAAAVAGPAADALMFSAARRAWRAAGGPELRARLGAERRGAVVFTAIIEHTFGHDQRWVVVVADSAGIVAERPHGKRVFSHGWEDIADVRRRWDGLRIDLKSGVGVTLTPITSELKRASDLVVRDGVARILAKRSAVHS